MPAPLTKFYLNFSLRATHAMNIRILYCREIGIIYTDGATPTQAENSILFEFCDQSFPHSQFIT